MLSIHVDSFVFIFLIICYSSRPRHPVSPRYPRLHLQKFTYTDGFLACASKPDLVLGVTEGEGRASEVTLKKKNVDDIFQRWIISSSG
jgi:hypothetical protein